MPIEQSIKLARLEVPHRDKPRLRTKRNHRKMGVTPHEGNVCVSTSTVFQMLGLLIIFVDIDTKASFVAKSKISILLALDQLEINRLLQSFLYVWFKPIGFGELW